MLGGGVPLPSPPLRIAALALLRVGRSALACCVARGRARFARPRGVSPKGGVRRSPPLRGSIRARRPIFVARIHARRARCARKWVRVLRAVVGRSSLAGARRCQGTVVPPVKPSFGAKSMGPQRRRRFAPPPWGETQSPPGFPPDPPSSPSSLLPSLLGETPREDDVQGWCRTVVP
jgi:hypothetical protein